MCFGLCVTHFNVRAVFATQGNLAEAESLYDRAVHVADNSRGEEDKHMGIWLSNLAALKFKKVRACQDERACTQIPRGGRAEISVIELELLACKAFFKLRVGGCYQKQGGIFRHTSTACGPSCTVKFRTLWISLQVCKIPGRWSMGPRLLAQFFVFCGDSLCRMTRGITRKDSYRARNPAVFLCCAKSSDEDCSVLLHFFTVDRFFSI